MPLIDMPLHELLKYQGSSPCPSDMNEFWDRSVLEMEQLGTYCELADARFQVPNTKCYDMHYVGVKGARIHAKVAMPAKITEKLPALCWFHGYSGRAEDFSALLSYVQAGFVIAALDTRGQAGESDDVGGVKGNTLYGHIIRGLKNENADSLLFRDNYLDVAQLARIVMSMDEVDKKRVGAFGISQGGGLTLACASLTPGLNRAAAVYPFLCDYKRIWDMDLDKQAYQELADYFRRFDPLHEHETETFMRLGYIDCQNLTPRIKAKVRMYTALMDNVCPPSTQFAAYNKMVCPKDYILYPDFGHEPLPYVYDDIIQFMLEM